MNMKEAVGQDLAEEILKFWFDNPEEERFAGPEEVKFWWAKNPDLDAEISKRFEPRMMPAIRGEYNFYLQNPKGRLALILLFDQFSRHIYRGTTKAFAQDPLALRLARDGIAIGHDKELGSAERMFFYLPLTHAEDLEIQNESVRLYTRLFEDMEGPDKWDYKQHLQCAIDHREVVQKFGRFPQRNTTINRPSTEAELRYLKLNRTSW